MSYIGNTNTSQGFIPAVDYFSGNGSTLAFTLSRNVTSVYQVEVVVDNVIQNPSSSYTVLNNVITFSSAPLTGTNNIWVRYVSLNTSVVQPGVGTVGTNQLGDVNAINSFTSLAFKTNVGVERMRIDASGNVGIGTSNPIQPLHVNGNIYGSAGLTFYTGGDLYIRAGTSGKLNFGANNTNSLMTLDSVGNLLVGTTSASVPSTTGFVSSANTFGFKNRIINGGMVIDQRNAGAAVTTSGAFTVDRFNINNGGSTLTFSSQQSTTAPSGYSNSFYFTVTAADSTLDATDRTYISQSVEGYNVADLNWGSANAKTVTLSFQVRSSLTGTFGGSLRNGAGDRSYPFTYSIPVANTWTTISVTIAGDTSGTWLTTNGIGVTVYFSLGMGTTYSGTAGSWATGNYLSAIGAVSLTQTNGATFYITGVQLEKGSVATSFDQRAYNQELAMCQRYYQTSTQAVGYASAAGSIIVNQYFPTPMRATPSLALASTTPYIENIPWATVSTTSGCSVNNGHMGVLGGDMLITGTMSGIATNQFVLLGVNQVKFSAEL